MPTDDLHGPTDQNESPLDLPLRRSMGSDLPWIRTLEDLRRAAGQVPLLLGELIDSASITNAERPARTVRESIGRIVNELKMWVLQGGREVLRRFNGHPEFGRIHAAASEVCTCVDCLCSLAFDYASTPANPEAGRRYHDATAQLRGAVDELHLLTGLRPLGPKEAGSAKGTASDNPFDGLLREFQEAYARYGKELFFLVAVTAEDWNADREHIDKMAGCLGFVPLGEGYGEGTPGYYVFGPLHKNRWGRWAERWEDAYETFEDLAARAGAALPVKVRDTNGINLSCIVLSPQGFT